MKYEIKNATNSTLKSIVVLFFYLFALFFSMYAFQMSSHDEAEVINRIINYLNYPIFKEYIFTEKLLYIFNNVYFLFYFVMFYIYEFVCFHSNLATRYKSKRWMVHKYLIGAFIIIIVSLIEYACIYYVFGSSMPATINYYIYPIIYKLFIMSSVYTEFNIYKTNKIASVISFILICFSLSCFNIVLYITLIISSFLLNYLFFDLRQFKYKFKK